MHTFLPPRPESFPDYVAFVAQCKYDTTRDNTTKNPRKGWKRLSPEQDAEIARVMAELQAKKEGNSTEIAAKLFDLSTSTITRAAARHNRKMRR